MQAPELHKFVWQLGETHVCRGTETRSHQDHPRSQRTTRARKLTRLSSTRKLPIHSRITSVGHLSPRKPERKKMEKKLRRLEIFEDIPGTMRQKTESNRTLTR